MTAAKKPPALLNMKIEPKTKADSERVLAALDNLTADDPEFSYRVDPESGEIILGAQSELQLDNKIDLLIRVHGSCVIVGAPQVSYRESLARHADIDYTHKKQTGGTRQFARVKLKLEPNEAGGGNVFEATESGAKLPKEFIAGIKKAVNSVWDNGTLIGFPMVNMNVSLCDGDFRDDNSSAVAFEIATRAAMKEGCEKGGVHILEPVMAVTTVTPSEFIGPVLRNFDGRRGKIVKQEVRGGDSIVHSHVPLANMFGYISDLKSLTQGHGTYEMKFDHYAIVTRAGGPDEFPPAIGMRA